MPIKHRDAKHSLRQKDFREDKDRGDVYFFFYFQGKKTNAFTYFSHGSDSQEITNSLIKRMKKELHLDDNQQVRELLECPLTVEMYIKILRNKNVIPQVSESSK
jgi:hypothetical protein